MSEALSSNQETNDNYESKGRGTFQTSSVLSKNFFVGQKADNIAKNNTTNARQLLNKEAINSQFKVRQQHIESKFTPELPNN